MTDHPQTEPVVSDDISTARQLAAHCAAYKGADTKRALLQLATTVIPFFALVALMVVLATHSVWLTLALAVLAAGFLVRLFIVQHDCGHGSFFDSRLANTWTGRLISLVTFTPYAHWRRSHALHHATSGNLKRRGVGDINTLTVREYLALPGRERLRYRLYRNPVILFMLGAPIYFLVLQRFPFGAQLPLLETMRSIGPLNVALVVVYGLLMAAVGVTPFLMAYLPVMVFASWIAGWMFFVQHQFEEAYWEGHEEWDFHLAAIRGSSYYALPRVLQWFTGNIGLHHIHHMCSRIPNYRLQKCMDDCDELRHVSPKLTLLDSLKCARLSLWDEQRRKLVGFSDLRGLKPA